MGDLGIRDLVGRAMIDKKFLADLVRDPVTMLADYDFSADERTAIMQAVGRTGHRLRSGAGARAPGRHDEALGHVRRFFPGAGVVECRAALTSRSCAPSRSSRTSTSRPCRPCGRVFTSEGSGRARSCSAPGDPGDELFLIYSGSIVVSKPVTGRVEQVLRRMEPGEAFGEMSLFGDEQTRSATIQAETDVTLLGLHRDNLNQFIESNPRDAAKFFLEMIRIAFKRLRDTSELVAEVTRWGLEATGLDVEHTVAAPGEGRVSNSSEQVEDRPKRARIELLVRRKAATGSRRARSRARAPTSRAGRSGSPTTTASWRGCPPACAATRPSSSRTAAPRTTSSSPSRERFLWERMDGHASLQEIGTAYVLRYGAFDFDIIPTLIAKLQRRICSPCVRPRGCGRCWPATGETLPRAPSRPRCTRWSGSPSTAAGPTTSSPHLPVRRLPVVHPSIRRRRARDPGRARGARAPSSSGTRAARSPRGSRCTR